MVQIGQGIQCKDIQFLEDNRNCDPRILPPLENRMGWIPWQQLALSSCEVMTDKLHSQHNGWQVISKILVHAQREIGMAL